MNLNFNVASIISSDYIRRERTEIKQYTPPPEQQATIVDGMIAVLLKSLSLKGGLRLPYITKASNNESRFTLQASTFALQTDFPPKPYPPYASQLNLEINSKESILPYHLFPQRRVAQ